MAVEQPQPPEPSVDPAARSAGARAPRPVEHPDTVADAAATPERAMPHRELGLKDKLPSMTEEEQYAVLASDRMLVKRPLLIAGDHVLVGFREKEWADCMVK